jgi:hypothetical protein
MRVAWQQTGSPVYLLPPRTDPEQYAILISQSLPYFMLPTAGEESLINYSIAIAAALYYLGLIGEISGEHGQRIISVFDCSKTVSSSIGHRIGRFLNTIKNDPTGLNIQVPGQGAATITETTQIWWGGGKEKIVLCLV